MIVFVLIDSAEGNILGGFSSEQKAKDYFRDNLTLYGWLDLYEIEIDSVVATKVTRISRESLV